MTKWISRASVMRIIDADPVYSDVINEKTYMASQISNLPTKEETPRHHGEWEQKTLHSEYFYCSECKYAYRHAFNFCPNCGSDNRPRILDEAFDGAGKDGNVKEGEEK